MNFCKEPNLALCRPTQTEKDWPASLAGGRKFMSTASEFCRRLQLSCCGLLVRHMLHSVCFGSVCRRSLGTAGLMSPKGAVPNLRILQVGLWISPNIVSAPFSTVSFDFLRVSPARIPALCVQAPDHT